ncbi:hypothetical protein C0993_010669, partial [Termitomyces sp. T159_Od127]
DKLHYLLNAVYKEPFQTSESKTNTSLGMVSVAGGSPESTSESGVGGGVIDETSVRFLSSDGMAFTLREEIIRAWTKNLLPTQHDQKVQLPEPSTTLEILFRFLQTSAHPDLEWTDFRILGPLSLAADSYGVYPAAQVCRIRREQALQNDIVNRPRAVMSYALDSQDWELVDKTVPFLIGESFAEMVKLMKTSNMIILWSKYLEKWDEVLQIAFSFSESRKVSAHYSKGYPRRGCNGCKSPMSDTTTIRIMLKLGKGVKSLRNLDDTFGTLGDFCCDTEREDIKAWRAEVERGIQGIPSFSSLLSSSDSELGDASGGTHDNT